MAEPRSAAQEAVDPSTSPERLLELTEKHPQLQRMILLNPSCPEVARQWILATNPWAKRAYEESREQEGREQESREREILAPEASERASADNAASDAPAAVPESAAVLGAEDDAPTALRPAAVDEGTQVSGLAPLPDPDASSALPSEPVAELAAEDPDAVSVWGDLGDVAFWNGADDSDEPATGAPTSSVRIAQDAGVVPLGPVPASASSEAPPAAMPAPAPAPAPADYPDYASPAVPGAYGTAAMPGAQFSAAPQSPQGQSPQNPYGAAASTAEAGAKPTAQRPGATDDEGAGPSRRIWWACGSCLLLSLLLVVAIAFAGRAWLSGDDDGYQRDSSTTAQEAPAEEPTAEPTEESPSQDPVSPAPDGAQEMTELRSPTGNIICLLEEDSVSCSVLERDFGESGLEDCENGPFSIQVADGEAAPACGSSFLSDSATALEYDQSAAHGNVACTSRFDGMTCWNVMTGKGFMVNRVTYETF